MSLNGIIFRKVTTALLQKSPPIKREIIFNTDTGEHCWLNENGLIVCQLLKDNDVRLQNTVFKGNDPLNAIGNNGDKFMKPSEGDVFVSATTTIRRPYQEYTKINGQWVEVYKATILERYEEHITPEESVPGALTYYVEALDE